MEQLSHTATRPHLNTLRLGPSDVLYAWVAAVGELDPGFLECLLDSLTSRSRRLVLVALPTVQGCTIDA